LVRALKVSGRGTAEPKVIAQTGWTSGDLLRAIDASDLQNAADSYDVVALLNGVNNQFRSASVSDFADELDTLTGLAIGFAGSEADRVILISIPDRGVTPFAEGAPRDEIASEIDEYNEIIRVQAERSGVRFIDVTGISRRAATELDLVAADGLHPSASMYAEWVELILPVVVEVVG
jgi:lysophospholipase L1-like esterase